MSQLTLLRHGQASFAFAHYDELSGLGVAQADATGLWLRGRATKWTAVLHGPRSRQADTATRLLESAGVGIRPQLDPGLDEFAEGEEILRAAAELFGRPMSGPEQPPRAERLRCYEAAYQGWARGEVALGGRASYQEFRSAVRQWFERLRSAPGAQAGQRILAVTSAGVICAIVCDVLGLPDAQWSALVRVVHNASLTEVLFSNERCGLRSFNSIGHLPSSLVSAI